MKKHSQDTNRKPTVTPLMARFQEVYKRLSKSDQEALDRKEAEAKAETRTDLAGLIRGGSSWTVKAGTGGNGK